MATTWDPKQYLKFAGPRLRPALDLLAQIYVDDVKTIYDLGSGPGNLTQHFKDRWPEAQITGIDNSEEMLDAARKAHPDVTWTKADLTTWRPDEQLMCFIQMLPCSGLLGMRSYFRDWLRISSLAVFWLFRCPVTMGHCPIL